MIIIVLFQRAFEKYFPFLSSDRIMLDEYQGSEIIMARIREIFPPFLCSYNDLDVLEHSSTANHK